MIELFSSETPNTRKISIMLEEIGFKYKLTNIDLSNGVSFIFSIISSRYLLLI